MKTLRGLSGLACQGVDVRCEKYVTRGYWFVEIVCSSTVCLLFCKPFKIDEPYLFCQKIIEEKEATRLPLDSLPIEILKFIFFYFYTLRLVRVYSKISSLLNSFCNFVDFSQEKSCDLILRALLPLNRLIYETKDNVFYSN